MRIERIEPSKHKKDRVLVFLEGGELLKITENELLRYDLRPDGELTAELLEEIKKSAAPDKREVKKYSVLDKAELDRGTGGIVCMCEEPIPIDEKNCFIPSNLI